LIKIKVR